MVKDIPINATLLEHIKSVFQGQRQSLIESEYQEQLTYALAYADLLQEDVEDVTDQHINLLNKVFSKKQIEYLTEYLVQLILSEKNSLSCYN